MIYLISGIIIGFFSILGSAMILGFNEIEKAFKEGVVVRRYKDE